MFWGASWRQANRNNSILHKNIQDAECCTKWKGRTERVGTSVALFVEIGHTGKNKSFAHHTSRSCVVECFSRLGRFRFLHSFWEHSEPQMLDAILALTNSTCLLALSRSDRHVLAALLCRADCAVQLRASGKCSTTRRSYVYTKTVTKSKQ